MHKLRYWVASRIDDKKSYNLRSPSRQRLVEKLKAEGLVLRKLPYYDELFYCRGDTPVCEKPRVVEINYTDRMDLVNQLLQEGGVE
jgi:hypothetical protein